MRAPRHAVLEQAVETQRRQSQGNLGEDSQQKRDEAPGGQHLGQARLQSLYGKDLQVLVQGRHLCPQRTGQP